MTAERYLLNALRLLSAANDYAEAVLKKAKALGLYESTIQQAEGLRRIMDEVNKILNEEEANINRRVTDRGRQPDSEQNLEPMGIYISACFPDVDP